MPWRWRWLLVCGLALLAGAAWWGLLGPRRSTHRHPPQGRPVANANPAPPNVLLISLDDVRPDHLGCYGYPQPTSASLDRFSTTCVRFDHAYTQVPSTLPSHMSLLTSTLPADNGVFAVNSVLRKGMPTLAFLLRDAGYYTAALVNNGLMQARWGFNRGFDLWREFEVSTPEGSARNITNAALQWLGARPKKPFFLFLHYYDAHLPYLAPADLQAAFGVRLTSAEIVDIVKGRCFPNQPIPEATLRQLRAAYDSGIAGQDRELGRLLAAVPDNTLVVVFSDHGEAFKEHGWTFHASSLYEEETHVVLLLRPPTPAGQLPKPMVVEQPVMLLDVMPTILGYCDVPLPWYLAGVDLRPLLNGQALPPRPILSETKDPHTSQMLRSLIVDNLKLIYSLFDGRTEVYRLPDEKKDLNAQRTKETDALRKMMKAWVSSDGEEDHWTIYAQGNHRFEVNIESPEAQFVWATPVGDGVNHDDRLEVRPDGQAARWTAHPAIGASALVFRLTRPEAGVKIDALIDGQRAKELFVGPAQTPLAGLPRELQTLNLAVSPWVEHPFQPKGDGLYVMRYRPPGATTRPAEFQRLDPKTIEQLLGLGYMQ